MTLDQEGRVLARELAAGAGTEVRLRYARLLERQERADEALEALLGGAADPEVRREIGRFPAWNELAQATRFVDAAPIQKAPRVAWKTRAPGGVRRLLASPLAILGEEETVRGNVYTNVLDPDRGEHLARLRGAPRTFDHELLLDASGIKAFDLWTGRVLPRPRRPAPGKSRPLLVKVSGGKLLAEEACSGSRGELAWAVEQKAGRAFGVSPELVFTIGALGLPARGHDRRTGRRLWEVGGIEHNWLEWLVDAGGPVSFSREHEAAEVAAYDTSGKRRWKIALFAEPLALLPGHVLAFVAKTSELVVLDRATGRRHTSFPLPERANASYFPPGVEKPWVAVARDVIYVADPGGSITALSLEGRRLWHENVIAGAFIREVAAGHGRLYGLVHGVPPTIFCLSSAGTVEVPSRPATPPGKPRPRRASSAQSRRRSAR
jgi:hypothetical protein